MKRLWASRRRVLALVLKAAMFVAGAVILYHEVFRAKTVDPLLIFVGLYFCGVPPALFFDGLRKFNEFVQLADRGQPPPGSPPSDEVPPRKPGGPWQL